MGQDTWSREAFSSNKGLGLSRCGGSCAQTHLAVCSLTRLHRRLRRDPPPQRRSSDGSSPMDIDKRRDATSVVDDLSARPGDRLVPLHPAAATASFASGGARPGGSHSAENLVQAPKERTLPEPPAPPHKEARAGAPSQPASTRAVAPQPGRNEQEQAPRLPRREPPPQARHDNYDDEGGLWSLLAWGSRPTTISIEEQEYLDMTRELKSLRACVERLGQTVKQGANDLAEQKKENDLLRRQVEGTVVKTTLQTLVQRSARSSTSSRRPPPPSSRSCQTRCATLDSPIGSNAACRCRT